MMHNAKEMPITNMMKQGSARHSVKGMIGFISQSRQSSMMQNAKEMHTMNLRKQNSLKLQKNDLTGDIKSQKL